MSLLILSLSFFWTIRTIKIVLFWIYLWQLKEYHIGRFVDHFRTQKGKKLIFGFLQFLKIILFFFIFTSSYFLYVLLILYIIESFLFIYGIARKKFKKPIFTSKTILLTLVSLLVVLLYLFIVQKYETIVFWLLTFDILTPLIISFIVLFFQPFFIMMINSILEKAKSKRKRFNNLIVVGITGSYGKTSTKEFLTTILSSKFNCLRTPEHQNSEIGIAQTILNNLNEKHQIFIAEMGAFNKGGIKLLCDIVKPKIGIVTGVNLQHLSIFRSVENLLSAEGGRELADNLSKNGLLVINGDNKYCLDLYRKIEVSETPISKKVYSVKGDKVISDIWAEEVSVHKSLLDFVVIDKIGSLAHFQVNVLGAHNVQNLLGAILIAKELGMSLEEISRACQKIKPEQAGIILRKGIYGIDIIDSSYSSNPDGVMADLEYLSVFKGKKVIVMPCLIELGNKSSEIHIEIGKKIAEICDMAIITTRDKFEEMKKGALFVNPNIKIIFSEKPKEIFSLVTIFCKEGDAVLLEGGRPKELIKLLVK